MLRIFYVMVGGSFGALLRYAILAWQHRYIPSIFPWGTLIVNLIGSLLIGCLWGLFEASVISDNMRLFLFVGILGSFTTFSAFSLENFTLIRNGEYSFLFWNI